MDYSEVFSKNLPASVEMPTGLRADTAHIFSVTNAVPQAIDAELYAEAIGNALRREATSLAGYPGLKGHEGFAGAYLGRTEGQARRGCGHRRHIPERWRGRGNPQAGGRVH